MWGATNLLGKRVGMALLTAALVLSFVALGLLVVAWILVRRPSRRTALAPAGQEVHVVVAGGGFGGVAAGRTLKQILGDSARVTVVTDANFQLYTPLLPQAASGRLEPTTVTVPLREQLRGCDIRLGRIVGGDPDQRCLEISPVGLADRPGEHDAGDAHETISYDHLILALGSVSRLADVPGLVKHGIGFKTLPEAFALRNWIISTLEAAEALENDAERVAYLTYVFVGGGYAGVEGVAELQAFASEAIKLYPRSAAQGMRWILVDRGRRLMPEIPARLGEVATRKLADRGIEVLSQLSVDEVGNDIVRLSNGTVVPTRTLVWTAGVAAHPVTSRLGLPFDGAGRIRVDEYLQVEGREDVWAVGDAAAVPDPSRPGRACPPTAQHAIRQGRHVAANVAAAVSAGQLQPFVYRTRGSFVDLGRGSALAQTSGVRLHGPLAWVLARAYHASQMPGRRRKLRLLVDWGSDVMQGVDASELGRLGHPRSLLGDLDEHSAGGTDPHGQPTAGGALPAPRVG